MGNSLKDQHYKNMGITLQMDTLTFQAESVAYTVCQYFGLDTSDYSFPYIAGWSSSVEMKELRASMDTIRKTAGEMIDGMTEVMQRLMREQQDKESLEETMENQEKYQEVEFFDVPALFANERVDMATLPQGIYRYELRGSDNDPGYPVTVENHVTVNYAATILTAFPLDLSGHGWLRIGDGLNFTRGEQTIREYQQAVADRNMDAEMEKAQSAIGRENEELHLSGEEDRYAVYQIAGTTKGRDYRFMGLDFVASHDMKVDAADYGYVYGGRLSENETLDSLYEKFNINHPAGYEGHSLSVSDIVVLQKEGTVKAYYVDSFGFTELPDFVRQRLYEMEMDRKRWFAPVTLDSDEVEIDQHEGYWHPVERFEAAEEVFYLMKHNEYGDSVASVLVNSEGDLVAQDLENGIDRGAIEAVREYFAEKEIEWEPGEEELEKWGIKTEMQEDYGETELTQKQYPPVYRHTLAYAVEHSAADEYLDSRRLNIQCKQAVEDAIRNNFDGLRLADAVAEPVLVEYGQERLSFVLACSVRYNSEDGRISRDTKEWAESIEIPDNISRGIDANRDYVVDSHPGVLDVFITMARKRFAELEQMQEPGMGDNFIGRYYVVNDAYGVKAEREYQYFQDIGEALSAYSKLPNHLDKQLGMESRKQPPSRMPLVSCVNGMEEMEDIAFASLSGEWVNPEVKAAQQSAGEYLENYDKEVAYWIKSSGKYLFVQTGTEGYDYTLYDKEYKELDGGVYDDPKLTIREALEEILADEERTDIDDCEVIDCENFLETVERAEYFPQKSYEALKELMNSGADEIAFRAGYGYVSVQKVPEGYEYIDYDDKWQEIDGDFYGDPDASMEDVVSWIFKKQGFGDLDCIPMDYQTVVKETLQSAKGRLPEDKLTPTSQISRKERALGGESRHDIEETVLCYAQAQIEDMGLGEEVKLNAARVYGCRTRTGLYDNASDLDVVLSYTGNIREDDFFSALHKDGMSIAGLTLDINPISTEKTGTILEYLEQAEKYLDDKELRQLASDIDEFSSEYDLYEYRDSVNNREENVSMIYSALASGKAEPIWKWIAEIAGDENDNLPEVVEDAKKLAVRIEQAQKMGRAEIFHDPEQVDAKITFYVTECMEFPVMGEYYENLTLEEAVQKYYEIPADRINGIKGIGFRLEDGSMYDGDYELMSAGVILKESIDLVLHYKESPLVQQAIADLEQILSERQQEKNVEKPQEKQSKKEPEQAQEPLISADKEKAISVPETFPEPQKQLETIPEKDNSVPEGTGRKQSVLKALRERQAKLKQEQKHTEQKTQNYKKGEQELC